MANGIYERQGNIRIDGYGYAGRGQSLSVPVIEEIMQEFVAGGVGGTLEIPMGRVANMESTFTIRTHEPKPYQTFGKNNLSVKYMASAVDDDGVERPIRYEMRGRITKIEEAEKSPEGEHTFTMRMHVTSYGKFVDDEEAIFIDIKAVIFRPDGKTDVWESMRKSLGI